MPIRARLLYNPMAGRFPAYRLVARAARVLERLGWATEIVLAEAADRVAHHARQAALDGCDVLVVAGGDGTAGQASAGLAGSETALAVLPSGTANVWAQELHLPRLSWSNWLALDQAARQLGAGRCVRVDVARCSGDIFLLWAGVGLDAHVVRRREPHRRRDRQFALASYFAEAVWSALDWHGIDLTATTETESVSGHFLLAVTTNIHAYAGGLFRLAPDARMDDGWLDLWLFAGHSFAETLQRAWEVYTGRHLLGPGVRRMTFRRLRLEADTSAGLQLDGEPREGTFPVEIEVWPRALKVLVPRGVPQTLFADPVGTPLRPRD